MSTATQVQRPELKTPGLTTKRIRGDRDGNLEAQTKLPPKELEELMSASRKATAQFLVLERSLKDQDQDKVKQAVTQIVQECPFISDYEEHWPAYFYLKFYLKWKAIGETRKTKEMQGGSRQAGLPRMKHTPRRRVQSPPRQASTQRRTVHVDIKTPPPRLGQASQETRSMNRNREDNGHDVQRPIFVPYFDDPSQAIRSFVGSLPIPMDEIFHYLLNEGLRTMAALVAFARWKGLDDHLMGQKSDRRLSSIQYSVLRDGLHKLAEEM